MQFEQAYYTSCRSGLEGGSGFQVQAASGGITPADYPELGRVGGCHLFSPGQIESPNNSPFSISYLPGRGDYSYLCRSVDTGKDSYGRPGQFFTHILRARSHREDFWHWLIPPMAGRGTFWAASPAPTPLLPPLSGTALRVDGGWKSLMLGLKDCPNPGRFALWLEAAFRSLEQGEKLITALRENHFALLLTALMAALPRSLARSISFCTYSADPFGEDVLICSTSPEGLHGYDFAHYPGFRLVNFLEPNDKSAIGEISPLAVFLAEALHQGDLGAVMAWQQFLAPLDFTFRAEDLRVIFQAFQKTQTRKGRPFTRAGQKMIHPEKAAKAPAVRG
ncbi:MAG TPA: hypothetical protein PKV71_07780, partial [Calditrichia bacterium]|nr:hypothetical protein [Calditrichia bacterium]